MAGGAAASALRRRQPGRRRRQYRGRGRRPGRAGWLHAAHLRHLRRDQRHALRQAGFRFSRRFRADRRRDRTADGAAGQSSVPGQDAARIHRLCQSQSWQDQFCLARHRHADACGDRIAQDAGRHRRRARALSRPGAGIHRSLGRTGSSLHHHAVDRDRLHQERQAARLGGDQRKAGGSAAGCCGDKRGAARLRCHGLGWGLRAEGHAARRSSKR